MLSQISFVLNDNNKVVYNSNILRKPSLSGPSFGGRRKGLANLLNIASLWRVLNAAFIELTGYPSIGLYFSL